PERYDIFTLMGADGSVDGVQATSTFLRGPYRLVVGSDGSVYFSESFSFRIRKITPDGMITTLAGNGSVGIAGDGGPADCAQIGAGIGSLALDSAGNLYFGDTNSTIRKTVRTRTLPRLRSGFQMIPETFEESPAPFQDIPGGPGVFYHS